MKSTKEIFVLVGKRVRNAQARFSRSGEIAIIDTPHGPVEFKTWFDSHDAAQAAVDKKRKTA